MPVAHFEVDGRVQGVGFRWFAKQCAQRKGITGWAMNRADGCVEVAAKGGEEELQKFRLELQKGPPGAHVSAIRDLPLISESELGDSFKTR
jgi:acylphosphatase